MSHTILNKLIISTVEQLLEVGLYIKAVVCDQGTNNQAAYKDLGMSKENPFFYINNKIKIYGIYDAPHLIKNYRNNFLTGNFLFKDKLFSFKDIVKTYKIDKNSYTSKALTKLTDSHINPGPFQKMNCKLAFQIFSNSVAATIHTCIATGELKSNTAKDTAIFVKHMNDLLDTLNSNFLFDKNPLKSALLENKVLQFLNLAKEWNLNLQKIIDKGITRPPCFNGMVWALTAIIHLYEDQKEFGFEYLMTARLNQDFLENSFSVYRQEEGITETLHVGHLEQHSE